ncbi:polysaccharide biosynthesis/export family protein [Phycobium rhodophyticola]
MKKPVKGASIFAAIMSLSNCASLEAPKNIEHIATGKGYQAQYRAPTKRSSEAQFLRSAAMNAAKCLPLRGGKGGKGMNTLAGERLTRNDLVEIFVSDDDTFSGSYVVSRDGTLKLPFLRPIQAQGRLSSDIERDIASGLLSGDYFIERPRVSVRVKDFSSVTVGVSGAVFEPHAVEIGAIAGDRVDGRRQDALGASSEGRNLSAALRAAGVSGQMQISRR